MKQRKNLEMDSRCGYLHTRLSRGFQSQPDSKIRSPVLVSVVSEQRPGLVAVAAVFPEFIAREKPGRRGRAVKETSAGLVRTAAAAEDSALCALTAGHRRLRSRNQRWGKERRIPR